MAIYGDTSGTLSGHEHGHRQLLTGDLVFGDAQAMRCKAHGGNDTITGIGERGGTIINDLYGDAHEMHDSAKGGNDILTGGDSYFNHLYGDASSMDGSAKGGNDILTAGNTTRGNDLYGDAAEMHDSAKGGDDILTGKNYTSFDHLYGDASLMDGNAKGGDDILTGGNGLNSIYGDAGSMDGSAKGGDDILTGGNGRSLNWLYGDASSMDGSAKGGDDRLVSGLGTDQMWGDAQSKDSTVVTGADVFAFAQNNGQDTINDFEHGKDHIDLTAFKKLTFANLQISSDAQGDSIIDLGKGNTVTVVGDDHLTANDFYFKHTGKASTVSDGVHTASIALLGQYMAASFVPSADAFGGTLVHDLPPANVTEMLTQPQHA